MNFRALALCILKSVAHIDISITFLEITQNVDEIIAVYQKAEKIENIIAL
jgi:peptidase E